MRLFHAILLLRNSVLFSGCQTYVAGKCLCPQNTRYNDITEECETCQLDIGGHGGLNCESCTNNGPGKCDLGRCPPEPRTWFNTITNICESCQLDIGGRSDMHCTSCNVNKVGKCDSNGCPSEYKGWFGVAGYVSYNSNTQQCEVCQRYIEGQRNVHCSSCITAGAGRCDKTGCPKQYKDRRTGSVIWLVHNSITQKCELNSCQLNIGNHDGLNCEYCINAGSGKCDSTGCPDKYERDDEMVVAGVGYNNATGQCEMCQLSIGNHAGLNCLSCKTAGGGKCDWFGCPAPGVLFYNSSTQLCQEILPKRCNT